jgi:hypothetical protein
MGGEGKAKATPSVTWTGKNCCLEAGRLAKNYWTRWGFRGISRSLLKSPLPPFAKGGIKSGRFDGQAMTKHINATVLPLTMAALKRKAHFYGP